MSKETGLYVQWDVKFMYDNLEGFDEDCALNGKLLDSYTKTDNKKSTDDMV